MKPFRVVMPYFNPAGHVSRRRNHLRFMEDVIIPSGEDHLVVEVAYGSKPHEVTELGNPNHLQLRVLDDTNFLKESALNVGFAFSVMQNPRLITDDGILMHADSDFRPTCSPKAYFQKVREALDHYSMVQCFENLVELGPDDQFLSHHFKGFMANWEANGRQLPRDPEKGYPLLSQLGGPGLCWAAHVSIWNKLGGLIDITPTGGDDQWQIFACLGLMDQVKDQFEELPEYFCALKEYEQRALEHLKKDIGYVRATVEHFYHGDKASTPIGGRFYGGRNQILTRYRFNPHTDLKRDIQGLWQLDVINDRQIGLRDEMRDYMLFVRNEDMVPHRQPPNRPEYKRGF